MSETTKGYTIPRGTGAVGPVIPVQEGGPGTAASEDTVTQWVLDILSGGVDANKPLGDGFQSKYTVPVTELDKATGAYLTREMQVDAQEYLTNQGYNFIYYPYMAGEVARDIAPALRIILKNQMASVGLIDLTKTQGSMVDEEFTKGIRRLMEFSMNNGGKLDWVQSLGILRTDASVRKSAKVKQPVIENTQLDDIVDDLLAKAKARKGAPLSQEEKNYITNKIGSRIGLYNQELQGLAPATEGKIIFDPNMPTGGRFIAGTPAQEPDTEQLAEDLAGIEEDVFAPREEAARQQVMAEETRARGAQTVADLSNLFRAGVKR